MPTSDGSAGVGVACPFWGHFGARSPSRLTEWTQNGKQNGVMSDQSNGKQQTNSSTSSGNDKPSPTDPPWESWFFPGPDIPFSAYRNAATFRAEAMRLLHEWLQRCNSAESVADHVYYPPRGQQGEA